MYQVYSLQYMLRNSIYSTGNKSFEHIISLWRLVAYFDKELIVLLFNPKWCSKYFLHVMFLLMMVIL